MKLGRNDKCHCGSGKKYKKCCIEKDAALEKGKHDISSNPKTERTDEEEWEDFYYPEDDDGNEEYDEVDSESGYTKKKDKIYVNDAPEINEGNSYFEEHGYNEEYPKISKADDKRIDDWYDIYKKIDSADRFKEHLDDFLNDNSKDVIINMALEEEVLFELIDHHVKEGKSDLIFDYMIQFRAKYPDIYNRSFTYYDEDVIAWLISKNRTDEVPQFLNYFELYPLRDVDKLFNIINLMLATNNSALALPLIGKIYKKVWFSDDVIGGYKIADSLIAQIYSQFANENYTKDDAKSIISELKKLELDFDNVFLEEDYWDKRMKNIMKDYNQWDETSPTKRNQFVEKILAILSNFSRFLHERKNIDYASADYCTRMLGRYYDAIIIEKKPKNMFSFPKKQIERTIVTVSQDIFSLNLASAYTILNGLYYFAEYLFECGNYDENQKNDVQKSTIELADLLKQNTKDQCVEILCFEKFPLF